MPVITSEKELPIADSEESWAEQGLVGYRRLRVNTDGGYTFINQIKIGNTIVYSSNGNPTEPLSLEDLTKLSHLIVDLTFQQIGKRMQKFVGEQL